MKQCCGTCKHWGTSELMGKRDCSLSLVMILRCPFIETISTTKHDDGWKCPLYEAKEKE